MAVTIQKAESKDDVKQFIHFPWQIYRGKDRYNPNWVPPLLIGEKELFDREKNPFFQHAAMDNFMAFRDGKAVGRISAVVDDNYVSFHNEKAGFFGFFESENDPETALALLKTAEDWTRERGMEKIIGPMNPSTNHMLGVLIDSFDEPPIVQMNYNEPYYPELFEAAGYSKEKDLLCYRMTKDSLELSEKIARVTELAKKRGKLTIRNINMKKFGEEVDMIRDLYNQGWEKNWGFVPWTREEFDTMAEELKMIARPELVLMVFAGEKLVGISIPIPNINEILITMNGRLFPFGIFKLLAGKNKTKMMRMAIMGVHPDYHNKGIDAIFTYETYKRGVELGFQGAEFSWILEDNYALRNLLETWGTTMYRTYRVYGKKL
jgi:GNAT superfamily N-acetyltransferase